MKKIIILAVVALCSCGNESVRHTKLEPFIIKEIKIYSDGSIKYSKGSYERPWSEFFAGGKQSIIFDKPLNYKVGDTLRFE